MPLVNELKKEVHGLRDEKNRLNVIVNNLQSEKVGLQRRVQELEEDLMLLRHNMFKTRQQSDGVRLFFVS